MTWLLPPLPPKWSAALRDVAAQRFEARLAAAQRLGQPADAEQSEQALPALRIASADRDARIRAAAIESLVALIVDPIAPATPALHEAISRIVRDGLADPDSSVRELATLGLADLGGDVAAEGLRQALESEHPEVRFQAVRAATESSEPGATDHVLPLLDDPDAFVRSAAVRAAGMLPPDARPEPLAARLRAALSDSDHAVRCEAAIALAEQAEPAAADALLEALSDTEHLLDALDVAPLLGDDRVRERVAFLAGGVLGSRLVAAAAGRALARMADPRGVRVLRDALGRFRTQGRTLAVQTIGELSLAELASDVIKLSERPRAVDPEVLATSLANLSSNAPHAAEALQKLASRRDAFGEAARATISGASRFEP